MKIYVPLSLEESVAFCVNLYEELTQKKSEVYLLKNGRFVSFDKRNRVKGWGIAVKVYGEILTNPKAQIKDILGDMELGFYEDTEVVFDAYGDDISKLKPLKKKRKITPESKINSIIVYRDWDRVIRFKGQKILTLKGDKYYFLFKGEVTSLQNDMTIFQADNGYVIAILRMVSDKYKYEISREVKVCKSFLEAFIFLCRQKNDGELLCDKLTGAFSKATIDTTRKALQMHFEN